MGCGNANDTKAVEYNTPNILPIIEYKIINIIFKLPSGEEYQISGKENELFKTVLDRFISEHQEINNKTVNALFQNIQIDLNKTLAENNIQENNLIILNIEEPEQEPEQEPDVEENEEVSIEYNLENVIWIDENVDNEENTGYLKELNALGYNVQCFKNVDEGFDLVKSIRFESTKIIISGRLYIKFVKKFIDNINTLYVIPKIIIFTRDKERFIKSNKANEDLINHPFFNCGGIKVIISDVISFLKDEIVQFRVQKVKKDENKNINNIEFFENRLKMKDNAKLTFEYIDNNQKLTLPLFYKALIDSIKIDDIEKFTENLYSRYSEYSYDLKELLNPIKSLYDIPIELLSKYYTRIYTIESDFYREINKDLRENNNIINYLPYIKVLYEGIKLKSLNIASDFELYRGSKISYEEIDKIKGYLNDKIPNLPGAMVFSKSFLSFSKEKSVAESFLGSGCIDNNLSKVLYILEKNEDIDYSLSTHTDVENISIFNSEKEVLFFPFSPFEIKEIKEIDDEDGKMYEIRLLYLGKYLKEIEKDVNITEIETQIPDSEFKKQIIELGLIDEDKISNTKQIFNNFKQFQIDINNDAFKKFVVKNNPVSLYDSFDEEFDENKTNILTKSYNKNDAFIKNKLNQSKMLKKSKIISYDGRFSITIMKEGDYKIKVVNINIPNFLGEYLIPIWFEKEHYVKFKTEGYYRINGNSGYHSSFGLPSSMKFNYGATLARIGSGELFVLPSKDFIYFSKFEGPLYLKINFPKNIDIKPEGKLTVKIYDGELLSKEEIYKKIGWKEKSLKYDNKKSTILENDLTIYMNNLRMNPILFYESNIKDDKQNKTWIKEFIEKMGKSNESNGIQPFSVNNIIYNSIRDYIQLKSDNIKKTLTKKNSIGYMKELQELLEIYLQEKINEDFIINCKIIKKSQMSHICMQYLYDKDFIVNIFNKEYDSIAIHIKEDIFDDFYLVILAISKINNNSEN